MRNLVNFVLFQVGWFACVLPAAEGRMWLGPLAVAAIVALHLGFVSREGERARELRYVLLVGLLGLVLDTGLRAVGAIRYPTSEAVWSSALAPPWITALWVLFATLPFHSLQWLKGRTALAVGLGAVGGPLSFLAGSRSGAVGFATEPALTWICLAVEYAVVTPWLLHFAPDRRRGITSLDRRVDPRPTH